MTRPAKPKTRAKSSSRILADARKAIQEGEYTTALSLLEDQKDKFETDAEFMTLLGVAAIHGQNLAYAIQLFERAQDLPKASSDIPEVLAVLHALVGNLTESLYYAKLGTVRKFDNRVLDLLHPSFPPFATAFTNIKEKPLVAAGESLLAEEQFDQAIDRFSQHVTLNAKDEEGYDGLTRALIASGDPITAVDMIRSLRLLAPDKAAYASRLGRALTLAGEYAQAEACHRQAILLDGDSVEYRHAFLRDLAFAGPRGADPAETVRRDLDVLIAAAEPPSIPPIAGGKQLRVGYLLGGLAGTDERDMVAAVVRHHDRSRFSPIGLGYGDMALPHNLPFQMRFDRWVDIRGINERTLASMIRGEGIDILVDLQGAVIPEQLKAISHHTAPLQVSWPIDGARYAPPGTDFEFATSTAAPPSGDSAPTPWELPSGLFAFRPPEEAGADAAAPLPAEVNGYVSFGVDATLAQLNSEFVMLLSRVMSKVPQSMVLLRDRTRQHPGARNRIIESFGNFGMAHRVDLLTEEAAGDFFLEIDVHLIAQPHARPFSAAEAVRRGVPVVALNRPGCASQDVTDVLRRLDGAADMIGETEDAYVDLAALWANDADKRAGFRSGGPEAARASLMFDPVRFTAEFEAALDSMVKSATAAA